MPKDKKDEILEGEIIEAIPVHIVPAKSQVILNTTFTPELQDKLILAARENPSMKSCGEQHGVPYSTLRYWLQRGAVGVEPYATWSVQFQAARSLHKDRIIKNLYGIATDPDHRDAVRAASKLLSKLWPEEFADSIYVGAMIEKNMDGIDLSILDQSQRRELMKTVRLLKKSNDSKDD